MESIGAANTFILLGALLVLAGIFSSLVATRFGAPLLFVFLGIGMLAGEDGLGRIRFDDLRLTYLVGSLALAVILFDGGLKTHLSSFRVALRPALMLATVGVAVTTLVAGGFAMLALGFTPLEGLLLGATVASTDAAAVFFLMRSGGLRINERVGMTLEIEAGTNDPVAIFLTLAIVQLMLAGSEGSAWAVAIQLAEEVVIGGTVGLVGGWGLSWLLNKASLPAGLQPVFVVTGAIFIFAFAAVAEGSGFLAVYLAGLVVGNRPMRGFQSVMAFNDAATWFAQIGMFLVLGLLVTPSQLVNYAVPALIVSAGLIFIARPLAVFLSLLPFRFTGREQTFISWVGLRGAVGIFLASIPLLSGIPKGGVYFNVAFFVVLVSLLVQGWTITPAAKRLGLALPTLRHPARRSELDLPGELEYELVGYAVPADSPVLHETAIPDWAKLAMVIRNNHVVLAADAGALRAGDHAYLLAAPWRAAQLDHLFAPPDEIADEDRGFFGEFTFRGDTTLAMLRDSYGIPVAADIADRTIAGLFAAARSKHPVVGDRLRIGEVMLIVQETQGDRVSLAGLELDPPEEKPPGPWLSRLQRVATRLRLR